MWVEARRDARICLTHFKLLETAQKRWRRINGVHVIPLVRAAVRYRDGAEVERRTAA